MTYLFEVNSDEPLMRKNYYIKATDGEIWAIENLLHDVNVTGTANTKYRGLKTITTDSIAPGNYRLRETGRGGGIETYNMLTGTKYNAAVDFTDSDNYWNNYNAAYDEIATDAHYGAEVTYDYYFDRFNRNSFDNNGAKIRSYVHYRKNYVNAFWNGSVMTYGDGNGTSWAPLTSIDICGHEVSHAVTTNSAGLIYSYESGALNESFSDIFGNAIEYYADSLVFSWKMGEDIMSSGTGLRNMSNPNLRGDPDTYKGTYWKTGSGDNGGVHTNSGVQNYWFYLLSQGKAGTNDNGDAFDVDSLGIHKAEQIAYRNLTVYLTKSSQYSDARYYGIRSAADLYGDCSHEMIVTTNAWHAVGVGDEYDSSEVVADFIADTLYCSVTEPVAFFNRSVNAKSYLWDFGDGTTSTLSNPIHRFSTQGYHSVELQAEGCYNSVYDTINKQNYIRFDSTRDICDGYFLRRNQRDSIHACHGFVYDNGAESRYIGLSRDTLTIEMNTSDSAFITFEEFSYENGYDSIYLYDGLNTDGRLIGGYTGTGLPNGGLPIRIDSGAFTITHFSDPFLEGSGFKAEFQAYRPALSLTTSGDTTICFGQEVTLYAKGVGGSEPDHSYRWNGISGDTSFIFSAKQDTVVYITFGDDCIEEYITDSIVITVLDSLQLAPISDTTICYLESISLTGSGSGGRSADYSFEWIPSATTGSTYTDAFRNDTTFQLSVSDGCSPLSDTIAINVFVRAPLSHIQSKDTSICQGTSAELELSAQGGLSTYTYSNSEGTTQGPQASHTFNVSPSSPGDYTYWVNYTDNCSVSNDTAFFNVTVLDSLQVDLGNDTSICDGSNFTLEAKTSGGKAGSLQYDWGTGYVSVSTLDISPTSVQTYYVSATDGCSTFEPTDSIEISLLQPLNVTVSGPDSACFGETINLQATITGGIASGYQYNWESGNSLVSDYDVRIDADRQVDIIVNDGCTVEPDTAFHQVFVREALSLTLPSDQSICSGKSYDITTIASGGIPSTHSISWDNGLGDGTQKTVSPLVNNRYVATLSDNCSDNATDTIEITVDPLPIVSFDILTNPGCSGLPIEFTNETTVGASSTFVWHFGDQNIGTRENETHRYSNEGQYTVKLVVTDENGCIDSLSKINELNIVPHPVANFTNTPNVATFFEPEFQFINLSAHATDYEWTFGDGGNSVNFGPVYSYSDTGYYTVRLVSSNDLGCSDTLVQMVEVEDVFVLHIPNTFTPNGDGTNDTYGIVSRGILEYNMQIFTKWGEKIWETKSALERWDGKYNNEPLQNGMYIYRAWGEAVDGTPFERSGGILIVR
ncbi:MAG: M4 family metallopeptidase [Bacteroidia bacterium]